MLGKNVQLPVEGGRMTYSTTLDLLRTKKEVLVKVNQGELGVSTGASLLGITRQGFWKLRKRFNAVGYQGLVGRKRGPKSWFRIHNRTPEWVEDRVEALWNDTNVGPDDSCGLWRITTLIL